MIYNACKICVETDISIIKQNNSLITPVCSRCSIEKRKQQSLTNMAVCKVHMVSQMLNISHDWLLK